MDAKRQKPFYQEKVCFVCEVICDTLDYYFFIRDLSKGNNIVKSLVPLVRLESIKTLSFCGIDSTVFMVEGLSRSFDICPVIQPVYYLDLDPNKHKSLNLNLNSGDLRKLPPMSADKFNAVITRVPNSKRVVVFSTLLTLSQHSKTCDYNDNVDPSTREPVDFEMYDLDTESWVTLPRFCLRIACERSPHATIQLYDPVARSWNRVRRSNYDNELTGLDLCRITRFTFINDTTLLVKIGFGFMLKLDLASLAQGWKLYQKDYDEKVFFISGAEGDTWCAYDVGREQQLKLPLSLFDVSTERNFSLVTRLERKRKRKRKEYVYALQTALRKKNGYPQMVIDVVDAGGDEVKRVASFRSEMRKECTGVYPIYIFQYQLEDQLV